MTPAQLLTQYPYLEVASTLHPRQHPLLLESGSRLHPPPQQKRHYHHNHQCRHQEQGQDSQNRQPSPTLHPLGTSHRRLERMRDVLELAIITAHYPSQSHSRHFDLSQSRQQQHLRHYHHPMEVYLPQSSLNSPYHHRPPSWDHSHSTTWPGSSPSLQSMNSRRSPTRRHWIIRVFLLEP